MTSLATRSRGIGRRLSRRDTRALWVGVCLVAPVFAWRAVIAPYAAGVQRVQERAATTRGLLSREKAILRDAPMLPSRARLVAARAAVMAPRLFGEADTVAATAALAAWVREAARSVGLRVTSSDAAPVEARAQGVAALGVDVHVEGPFAAVVDWLDRLESGERVLVVERLEVAATGTSDGTIAASARVRGFAAPLARGSTGRRP